MPGQSKWGSVAETVASVVVGFGISMLINITVLPFFGFTPSFGQNLKMVSIFTIASLIRGYGMRRLFNWIHHVRNPTHPLAQTDRGSVEANR